MTTFDHTKYSLRDGACDIFVGVGAIEETARACAAATPSRRIAVLGDEHVLALHAGRLARVWADAGLEAFVVELPRGEAAKTFAVVEGACRRLVAAGIERTDLVVGVGGGAATDAAGFIAAITLRGIGTALLPTSLLGMVDAAIGGKTAIDLPEGKNLVGAFHAPRFVGCDLDFLSTLPEREFHGGLAEIVKIAWIADPELLTFLERDPPRAGRAGDLRALVRRAIERKMEIVLRDERDAGARLLLNFGHTWGHAIETESGGALLHGEAVALGLVCAAVCSVDAGLCSGADLERLETILVAIGLPVRRPELDAAAVVARMRFDKKRAHGAVRVVLTQGVGSASVADHVSDDALRRAVDFLRR